MNQSPVHDLSSDVRFDVFTAVTMKNASSGMLCSVALVRTDVSEELIASIIRVRRIGELGTRCNIPEDCILPSEASTFTLYSSVVSKCIIVYFTHFCVSTT
jgi:hypothetical protein